MSGESESEDGEFRKTHRLLSSAQVSRGAAAGQELAAQRQLLLHRGRGQVTSACVCVCVTSSICFSSTRPNECVRMPHLKTLNWPSHTAFGGA